MDSLRTNKRLMHMRQDSIQVLIDSRRQNKVKEDLITAMVVTVKTRNNVKHRLTDTSPSLENTSFISRQ